MPDNSSISPPSGVFLSLEDVHNILSIIPSDAIANESSFMGIILEAALFGVYSLLIVLSSMALIRKGIRTPARALVMLACIVMYAMAATHFGLTINWIVGSNKKSVVAQTTISQCLLSLTANSPCTLQRYVDENPIPVGSDCLPAIMLTIPIILSDAIVTWRAWVLWGRNRTVLAVSAILVFATLGLAAKSTSYQCHLFTTSWLEFVDPYGVASWMLSWVTNVWATSLIGWKAWRHRRVIRNDRLMISEAPQTELKQKRLSCSFLTQTVLSVSVAIELHYKNPSNLPSTSTGKFVLGVENLRNSALVDLIGIYPTLLVTLTALSSSYVERTVRLDSIAVSGMQFQSNPSRERQRHTLSLPSASIRSTATGSSEVLASHARRYKGTEDVQTLAAPITE